VAKRTIASGVPVGSFEGMTSPITPTEPFILLHVELRRQIPFAVETEHNVAAG
jgi:hypothetical protein